MRIYYEIFFLGSIGIIWDLNGPEFGNLKNFWDVYKKNTWTAECSYPCHPYKMSRRPMTEIHSYNSMLVCRRFFLQLRFS